MENQRLAALGLTGKAKLGANGTPEQYRAIRRWLDYCTGQAGACTHADAAAEWLEAAAILASWAQHNLRQQAARQRTRDD